MSDAYDATESKRNLRILKSAERLVACIQNEREIKDQIDWKACANRDDTEFDELHRITYMGHEPCCFTKDESNEDNGMLARSEWCAVCEINWTLRGQVGIERKRRAGLLRGLVNAITNGRSEP